MDHIIFSKLKNINIFLFKISCCLEYNYYGQDFLNRFKISSCSSGGGEQQFNIDQPNIHSDGMEYGYHNGNGVGDGTECYYGHGYYGNGELYNNFLSLENNKDF